MSQVKLETVVKSLDDMYEFLGNFLRFAMDNTMSSYDVAVKIREILEPVHIEVSEK